MTVRAASLVAVPFAVLLTVCDAVFHVRTDTLVYDWAPQVLDQTVLVPLTFWMAAVGMLLTAARLGPSGPDRSAVADGRGRLVDDLVLVVLAYLVTGLVAPDLAGLLAALLLGGWVVRVVARRGGRGAVVTGLVVATGGVLGEAALSAAGEFSYLHADVLGVPWWLFPLYLHGSFVALDVVALARGQRLRVMPPSTGSSAPVTNPAAGDSRNAAALPNSSGRP